MTRNHTATGLPIGTEPGSRALSRSPSPRTNILGVGVNTVNMGEAVRLSDELIRSGGRGYICVRDVNGVIEAQSDPQLRSIQNTSFLTVPDGMPIVWVGRLQGARTMGRVYGPDFMIELCRASVAPGYRHFLYGGKPGVAQRLADSLARKVPGIQIAGTYTPPFRSLTAAEESAMIAEVRDARTDILWVGLGTPKQDRFMAEYIHRLPVRLMVGVGAAFDIHTGALQDAPRWMKVSGLQWTHRLAQEPRRLWRRYLINNPRFVWSITLQLLGITSSKDRSWELVAGGGE